MADRYSFSLTTFSPRYVDTPEYISIPMNSEDEKQFLPPNNSGIYTYINVIN